VTAASLWRTRRRGGLARFALESPDRRQTLSPELLETLADEAAAEVERGARLVVVESAHPGVFAAGADLSTIAALSPQGAHRYARRGQEALVRLAELPAVVLAEIDGPCFGGGLDLAMACDVVVSTDRSTFCHPGVRLGIVTGWGGTWFARRRLGEAGAARLFFDGRIFTAPEALVLGLVDEIIESRSWKPRLDRLEGELAARPEILDGKHLFKVKV
jgi:enoyl-CoA hydratase